MTGRFFGSLGNGFTAATAAELRGRLAHVDLAVPRRTERRRSEHRERYGIVHYLRTLEHNGLLSFPFKIAKGESPDFRIEMGSEVFGLEVTEAGSEKHQQAVTELEKAPEGSILEGTTVRRPGEPLQGPLWGGDEPERRWVEEVMDAIRGKTKQLGSYRSFPDYHLLVYDQSEFRFLTEWSVTELPGGLATAIRKWRKAEPAAERWFSKCSVLRDRVLLYDVTGHGHLLPVPPSSSLPPLLPLTRLGVSEEELHGFCRKHGIRKLGFFGSIRGDRFSAHSDVDVLVEFEPGCRIGLIGLAGVELELSRLLGRKADLRTVPDLSRYFREEVVRQRLDLAYVAG